MSYVIRRETPKARKQHRCDLCGRVIDCGEEYLRLWSLSDDGPYTWKECAHCQALWAVYSFSELLWYDEDYGYTPEDIRDGWEPDTPEAAEHKKQWLSRWHDKEGNLYPVPTGTETRHVEVRQPSEAYL